MLHEGNVNLGGFSGYNIYDECYLENDELSDVFKTGFKVTDKRDFTRFINQKLGFDGGQRVVKQNEIIGSGINQYACGGEKATNIYLNNAAVQEAINVPDIQWIWQGIIIKYIFCACLFLSLCFI